MKGGEKLKGEKLEQLRKVFKNYIETIIFDVKNDYIDFNRKEERNTYKNEIAEIMVREVKIRVPN